MDVVVKATKGRVPARARQVVERKAARLARHDWRVRRVEVNVIQEANPRVSAGHRVEGSAWTDRRSFHASGAGETLEVAVEQVVSRLDRQLAGHAGKRRRKLIEGANRVKSRQVPEPPEVMDVEEGR
ncbi:MAG TPA: HPF/RaiA family ribosome-associated protein [Actinomycetota bacterium]